MLSPCSTAVLNCMQVRPQASTIHLSFAAQAPDATTASLALQDNTAKPEGEVCPADMMLTE